MFYDVCPVKTDQTTDMQAELVLLDACILSYDNSNNGSYLILLR